MSYYKNTEKGRSLCANLPTSPPTETVSEEFWSQPTSAETVSEKFWRSVAWSVAAVVASVVVVWVAAMVAHAICGAC